MYIFIFFFFNDTATTEIYTLSLHDALPISASIHERPARFASKLRSMASIIVRARARSARAKVSRTNGLPSASPSTRSEEHTSELQSQSNLVCRLLLEKKKNNTKQTIYSCTT